MSLDQSEWLYDAKRAPLGGKRRIIHSFEVRPNMVVFNNEDSWSCWCFECNAGGKVYKERPQLLPETPPASGGALPLPKDCVALREAPRKLQEDAYRYLLLRGLDPDTMFEGIELLLSPSVGRLLVQQQGGAYVGRGMANQLVKAMTYCNGECPKYAHHPKDPGVFKERRVVLTEDYLSALKIAYCVPEVLAVSAQGTKLTVPLIAKLITSSEVSIMLDGDPPGVAGAQKIFKRLRGIVNTRVVNTPTGKDPKNLNRVEIRRLIHGDDR